MRDTVVWWVFAAIFCIALALFSFYLWTVWAFGELYGSPR